MESSQSGPSTEDPADTLNRPAPALTAPEPIEAARASDEQSEEHITFKAAEAVHHVC